MLDRIVVLFLSGVIAVSSAAGKEEPLRDAKAITKPKTTGKAPATTEAQTVCLSETDPTSPRHTGLAGTDTSSSEILRTDIDKDGDPDTLERWWNGRRARWFDENDNMSATDTQGDQIDDSVQIDRDGDGYYDGPDDMSVDWVDDDGDGDADLQVIAINPSSRQKTPYAGSAHYMIFEDVDDDNVHGYVDWQTFDFPCWRATNTTAYKNPDLKTSFSPDYNGNSIFLKEHRPPFLIRDPRYNWENPFAFYDTDGDGVTEMAIRHCDSPIKEPGDSDTGWRFDGKNEEAYVTWDLDNDSQRGNEMDYDMSLRFSGGELLDYNKYVHKHPKLKAPAWVLPFFRYTNWRMIDELIYVPHEQCYDETFKPAWGNVYLVFDEDDDDHRWERVEIYYPGNPYSTERWGKDRDRTKAGLCGHPQSDTTGDRGEYDNDFSGKAQLYVGRWDGKLHLYGAEWGAWTVDYGAKYWGSHPVLGDSSPQKAPKVEEVVQYRDTDNNGFLDEISYDYDGDKTVDLKISLLAYDVGTTHADVADIISPAELKWHGMHQLYSKIARKAWQDALKIYQAAWSRGLSNAELDDLAISASTAEAYHNAYWLKEKVFRVLDKKLEAKGLTAERATLHKVYFTGDIAGLVAFMGGRDWSR